MGKPNSDKAANFVAAGGASFDITPPNATFLYGYPHTPRLSTGILNPLLASALYLDNGSTAVLFIEVDLIWLPKYLVANARAQIAARTGVEPDHIMVTASHTHSGPVTLAMLSNAQDSIVPRPDPDYLAFAVMGIVGAAEKAVRSAEAAEVTVTSASCMTIGSNRLDPAGPRITEVPVLAARAAGDPDRWLGLMFINPVHPTVLHADSKLISGDFPAMCREFLQAQVLGMNCPVLCHLGAAGNQSPRYVIRDHSIAEARRLGDLLGAEIGRALVSAPFVRQLSLFSESTEIELPPRQMPSVEIASNALRAARERFAELQVSDAPFPAIRTAECAIFGAEETVALARASDSGELDAARESCLPAEIQAIGVGGQTFVGWPGEAFVEFAQRLRDRHPEAAVITLANGELQGYLVTAEAVQQRCYESGNAIFASPESGERLVAATLGLLSKTGLRSAAVATDEQRSAH